MDDICPNCGSYKIDSVRGADHGTYCEVTYYCLECGEFWEGEEYN